MDREKAKNIFQAYGRPQLKIKNTLVSFSRQTEDDIINIENKTDEDLIQEWKSLVFVNEIYGQVSLNDMQRIDLIELEFDSRKTINGEELNSWFEKQLNDFDNQNYPINGVQE